MSAPLRVVFDIAALAQGGMERQLVDVCSGLAARGHHPTLVVNKDVTAYEEEIRDAGVDVVSLGRERRSDLRVAGDIAEVLRRTEADVIVGVNFNATLYARLAARRVGIPAVTAEHSTERRRRLKVVVSNRVLARTTSAVIACAEAQVPSLVAEGNPRRKIVVVRNGVDAARFHRAAEAGAALRRDLGVPEDAFVVGLVAGHRREKRHDLFFSVLAALVSRGVNAYGLAVGGGPLLEHSRELAAASSVADRIIITGPRTDLSAVYSGCDVCVLCSVETLPLVLMESQACETPVVAMEGGGVAETFEAGLTGLLVGQGDTEAMAEALAELAADPGLAHAMGVAGRRWVAEHRSVDLMVNGYLAVLERAVAEGVARR